MNTMTPRKRNAENFQEDEQMTHPGPKNDIAITFESVELEDINVCYTEGVHKLITLQSEPPFHSVEKAVELMARKALRDFPLKFLPADNPFDGAMDNNNIFRVNIRGRDLVFMAAHYLGKNCVFEMIWQELARDPVPDGQSRLRR